MRIVFINCNFLISWFKIKKGVVLQQCYAISANKWFFFAILLITRLFLLIGFYLFKYVITISIGNIYYLKRF